MDDIFIDTDPNLDPDPEEIEETGLVVDPHSHIKWYPVELPSNGMAGYPKTIYYRDIFGKDEKMLASASPESYKLVLGNVLQGLIKDGADIFPKLTIHDFEYLVLWVWANNYTVDKQFETDCPICKVNNKLNIDLTKLPVSELDEDYEHPFELELSCGEDITIRLATMHDERVVDAYIKNRPNENIDYTMAMVAQTVTFNPTINLTGKLEKLMGIPGRDLALLRAFHKKFGYGVDAVVDMECTGCGEVSHINVPFQGGDLFFPELTNDLDAIISSRKASKAKSKRNRHNPSGRNQGTVKKPKK